MAASGKEIEVKFHVRSLEAIRQRLEQTGAELIQARQYEHNLRFDTADGQLGRNLQALRLRQDDAARMTYKGPPMMNEGARLRQELEVVVSDFDTARSLLEALGYQVVVRYEKYRATYTLGEALVTLDEMPFGRFVEIEAPDGRRVQQAAQQLGLRWEVRSLDSYLVLFERLRQRFELTFNDLTFDHFAGVTCDLGEIGVKAADE
jgi:adenylate cyclase class 2